MNLNDIAQEINVCQLCPLAKTRTKAVPGSGNPGAAIVFIGEGPGKNEDEQGLPFVGAAGKFLNEMLESIGLTRDAVFITNVVKCRPPGNRDPEPAEASICQHHYLDKQLELIRPKLVVTLGRHALGHFLPDAKISEVHGQAKKRGSQILYPLYHPAAALYQGSLRETLKEDFIKIPKVLAKIEELLAGQN